MVRTPNNLYNAFKILKITATGGTTVFASTVFSCYLAVVIEKAAHKVQYHFFPHWYKDVEFALGLDLNTDTSTSTNANEGASANANTTHNQITENNSHDNDVKDGIIQKEKIITEIGEFIIESEGIGAPTISEEAAASISSSSTIGLHHSELHPYWHDDHEQIYDHDRSAFDNVKYGEERFEIPTAMDETAQAGGEVDEESESSTIDSLQTLMNSHSGENMSSILQGCAMTA